MQNNRNYGFNQYQQFSASPRNQNDWNRETEWSAPDESWRGAERAPAIPYDTWKQRTPDPPRNQRDFQYGRDRAPITVDDQFLVRIGAKRMNNGNLVDRDGFTLRTRDPQCSAPSPPTFNPRREFHRGQTPEFHGPREEHQKFQRHQNVPETNERPEIPAKVVKTSELNVLSQDELDKRVKKQIEMMEKQRKNDERKQRRREKKMEENEGEDEYEEVETAPPPVVEPPNPQKLHLEAMKAVQNPVEKPETNKFSPKKQFKGYMEDQWFSEYQKRVEALKEQTYGNSSQPSTSAQIPAQTGYFFPSVPRSTSFSSPGAISSPPPPKPPQMDLPPPGIIPDSLFQPSRRHINLPPYQPPKLDNIDAFGVRIGSKQVVVETSDSEEEDEAVKRLREIIRNYGNPRN